jgi:plasmid stabilization system protein ParE
MRIEKKPKFVKQLVSVLTCISKDKMGAALKFERELNATVNDLVDFPLKYRKSNYFDDEAYRDLVYKGYTIVYKVETDKILILDIFKWQNR